MSPRLAALREWAARLLGTLTGRRRDADLEEELRAHAELAAEDGARRGGQVAYSDRARSRSIEWLRAMATSQEIGLRSDAAKRSAFVQILTKTSCSASSASPRSFKTRRQTPNSFALVWR